MEVDRDARKVFGLFVETLVIERDVLDAALLSRLTWFAEDVQQSVARLKYDPRAGRELMRSLHDITDELSKLAAHAETLEENVHQARRWSLLLSLAEEDLALPEYTGTREREGERREA